MFETYVDIYVLALLYPFLEATNQRNKVYCNRKLMCENEFKLLIQRYLFSIKRGLPVDVA